MDYAYYQVYLVLTSLILVNESAKILGIFPHAAKSHFTFNNAVMKSLINAGHQVTVITAFPKQASDENYTSIIDVSRKERIFIGEMKIERFITRDVFKFINITTDIEHPYCSDVLNLPEIQRILKSNEKLYDVVFVEMLLLYKCYLPVAEKMGIPIIGIVTLRTWLPADTSIHNPYHPAYIPFEPLTQKWSLSSIFGRIINTWNYIVVAWYKNYVLPKVIKKFHDDNYDQLKSFGKYMDMEPELIFYNNHASLLPRPMNPNAIDVGGIHMKSVKPLSPNIKKFIDEANRGVIVFSLGSVTRAAALISDKRNMFRDAFAEIPQRVIWKFEEQIENLSSNVMILDWLPQRDILEHENVIGFISHCGLGGMNEAVYTATPVIACPLFCDQIENAEVLEDLGVAVHLDIYDITKQNILDALNAIINDTRYYDNMQNLSKKFKDRPMTPQQSVVYWTEYVIRHNGASHLKSPAHRLHWFQFLMLDVVLIVIAILAFVAYFMIFILRKMYYYCRRITTVSKFDKLKNKPKLK